MRWTPQSCVWLCLHSFCSACAMSADPAVSRCDAFDTSSCLDIKGNISVEMDCPCPPHPGAFQSWSRVSRAEAAGGCGVTQSWMPQCSLSQLSQPLNQRPPTSPQSGGTCSGMHGDSRGLAGGGCCQQRGFAKELATAALLAHSAPARAGSASERWGTCCACSYATPMTFAACSGHPITGASGTQ